ncbi:citrate synthase, mitochondrial-like [Copidosoma floridanum]|uniref:citrate synthase, mitochondrial-like n=1 Tax=Copidosoma floridanum TaxID=29053 RepID=UPI0006C9905B|nr:citrate synthase, mitochondrial-like [Copidosoma floridanum]XP_014218986.1 citrate synthase, mitochondrial-like [Copidosoma floridanum]XP_014218995.1 citrate synthase, mitochondrial-like [Copidosoma floridanum]XP_014219003.1 citrate synthase, mitochondrial-like [Copidosoma floridanum]
MFRSVKARQDLLKSANAAFLKIDKAPSSSDFGKDFERIVPKLSTTRGVPSTSTDLKEVLCEKIPLHHDLLRKFHRVHGFDVVSQITVNDIYRGLDGVNALIRETSEYDPQTGIKYRGLSLPELYNLLPRKGNSPSPEAVFWLLLTGDVPTHEQAEALTADWTERRARRKDWWWSESSGELGGVVGGILKALPNNVPPVGRLAIALTALDADNHIKRAIKDGVMSYSYWEHIYEDSMELLASLPAIVALVSATETRRSSLVLEKADWIDFFLDCLHNVDDSFSEAQRQGLGDFLRLYVSVNADDEGGIPGAHVAQIMGTSQYDASRALAAGVLAYANEPTSGTLCQYMDFLVQFQNAVGREPKNEILRNFVKILVDKRFEFTGHKSSQFEDTRYKVLQEFVRSNVPNDPEIKLSQQISKVYTKQIKEARNQSMVAEQNAIAAPLFQFYGLRDMNYNQLLLCMSRALGIVASMIWTTALNAPVERPRAKCTVSYFTDLGGYHKGRRGKPGKHFKTK